MSDKQSRGTDSHAQAASPFRTLQSCVGKLVKLQVSYSSFQAPDYGKATQHISGRVWAYDEMLDVLVLEMVPQNGIPSTLHHAASAAACNVHGRNASLQRSGFKVLRGSLIEHADEVGENRPRSEQGRGTLSRVNRVTNSAMDIREAAGTKRSLERAHQIGPKEAGDVGQAVFDALSKTYVALLTQASLPLAWLAYHHIGRNLSKEQIEQLLSGKEDATKGTEKVERAQAKAITWQRVTKVVSMDAAYLSSKEFAKNLTCHRLSSTWWHMAPLGNLSEASLHCIMSSVLSKALPSAVKEIRLHLSPVGAGSAGARKFLETNYKTIKQNNPNLPFLVREARMTPARIFLRLERGAERSAEIDSLEPLAIERKIAEFLS